MPKISIIVPVYNAEQWLERCVDSIVAQTYADWELLLIDDGSTDCSGTICDRYAASDPRIRVFHKPNGGVSSARNLGLDHAKGEWITFVDSDDWVGLNYLKNLYANTKGHDLIIAYANIYYKDGRIETEKYPSYEVTEDNADWLFTRSDMSWHTSPWSKIYRYELIEKNNLRFDEKIHIGEDAVFLYSYMLLSSKIFISNHTDYCYQSQLDGSLTKKINTVDSELYTMKSIEELTNKLISKFKLGDDSIKELRWLNASYIGRVLNSLYHSKNCYDERLRIIKRLDIDTYIQHIGKDCLKTKFLILLLRLRLYNIYDFCRYFNSLIKSNA